MQQIVKKVFFKFFCITPDFSFEKYRDERKPEVMYQRNFQIPCKFPVMLQADQSWTWDSFVPKSTPPK